MSSLSVASSTLRSEVLPATAAALAAFRKATPEPQLPRTWPNRSSPSTLSATAAALAAFSGPRVEPPCTKLDTGRSSCASTRASSGTSTPVAVSCATHEPCGVYVSPKLLKSELMRLSTEYCAQVVERHNAKLQRQLDDAEARLADQDRLILSLEEVIEAKDMVIDALEEERGINDARSAF